MPYFKVLVNIEKIFVVKVPEGVKYPDEKAMDEVLENAILFSKNDEILEVTSEEVGKDYLELKKGCIEFIKYTEE